MTERIAIVGAGIAGAYLAYRLARAHLPVLVIDDGRPGRASAWNPGGINPLHGPGFPGVMERFHLEAFQLHVEQYEQVRDASGVDFGWRVVDRLFLAKDEQEALDLRACADRYNNLDGFTAEWLDARTIARWDPRVSQSWAGGLMTRGNVRVNSERYRMSLLAAATKMGAQVVWGHVQSLQATCDRIKKIDWGEGAVAVDALCIATGAWWGEKIEGWSPGTIVDVWPVVGDLLLVQCADAPPLADISHGLTAIYRHESDYFWVGGTARKEGPVGSTTDELERELLDGIGSLLPGWRGPRVAGRSSAARPSSEDGLPVVGRTPNYVNGWVINGLGGKGILLSSWAAEAILSMIAAGAELPEFAPVSPARRTG